MTFNKGSCRVHILVLGDVGRSPRMKFHAWSFAKLGWQVTLSGYQGVRMHSMLSNLQQLHVSHVNSPPACLSNIRPRALALLLKLIYLWFSVFFHILLSPSCDLLMVQSPPAVPTLVAAWLCSWIKRCQLLVDWHNYGYSLVALESGDSSFVTKLYMWLECSFAKYFLTQAGHLCVTESMRKDLYDRWGIQATTLYDKPGPSFRGRCSTLEMHKLMTKLATKHSSAFADINKTDGRTRFTRTVPGGDTEEAMLLPQRPALLVSSTSWTADEDFGLLVEALDHYNSDANTDLTLPDLVCVVTGKGALRSAFEAQVSEHEWNSVQVVLAWLEAEDYPRLLGCSDLGVSLHSSSSGLDLPMKVVDMFGAELPVVALNFPALPELVQENLNGRRFTNGVDLGKLLVELLRNLREPDSVLEKYRIWLSNWRKKENNNWKDQWNARVIPLLRDMGLHDTPVDT